MKKTLLFLTCSFFAMMVSAQQTPSFFSLNTGPSFPVGGYHSKELPDGGFALTGLNTTLEGAWFFLPWLGAGASASVALHPVDAGPLGDEKLKANPFFTSLVIRSDPYRMFSLNAGAFFQFPLVQRLSATAKVTGGIIYAQTPYQLYKAEYYLIGKNWYEVTSAGDYEATFLAGIGIRYDLNDCIGFSLQSDFTYNNMDFEFLLSDETIRTDQKVMSAINVTGGILFKIGRR
jgi:hypothetical protein